MENQLLTKLVSDNVFAVPQSFVARQLQYMVEDFKEKLQAKGFKREDLDARNKEFDAKFADDAARRVRILFILDEIAKKEGIEPQDDELEAAFLSIASQTEQSVEKVKEYYKKEDLIDDLREKIREEKTIRFLLKEANIVEAG
jgi:trigger factor